MRLLWTFATLALVLDQLSKFWVFRRLELGTLGEIAVFPPYLVFRKGMNTGVNFGLFADSSDLQRWLLVGLSLVLCGVLCIWAWRSFARPVEFASAGLVIGGALGNALDRILYPGVLDFLNMSCCGIDNPYVFNVADIFIFCGAIGLVLFGGDRSNHKKAP